MAETTWIPGMAARDPETGVRWRLAAIDMSKPHLSTRLFAREGGNTLWTLAITDDGRRFGGGTATMRNELTRALAAGPDLSDLTTAAVYAAQRGWAIAHGYDDGTVRVLGNRGTLPEAVQAAAKAKGGR